MPSIFVIGAVSVSFLIVLLIVRKLRRGGACCGEHAMMPRKIPAADRELSHYPYRYTAEINGMVCSRCVRNVENALHSTGYIHAVVHLEHHTAELYSKHPLTRKETAVILDACGYTLTDFKEETT